MTTDVWLSTRARDARAYIGFLVDALGFTERVVYGEGDRVDHAELTSPGGNGGVMLGSVREQGDGVHVPSAEHLSAYLVVTDADAFFARAVAAGAEVVREPFDTDYGSRECAVRDPEGGTWHAGTYAGHEER